MAPSSQACCAGSTSIGAVGPTGRPKIQLIPMGIRLMPIARMTVPVTTGGKNRSTRPISGASRMAIRPAAMIAPNSARAPSVPGVWPAMATIGPTAAKVTPIITGRRMPKYWVMPRLWIRVASPQTNRSAEIRKATSSGGSCRARPTISGTAMAPAYMTSTCWNPNVINRPVGSIWSTGWTWVRERLSVMAGSPSDVASWLRD